jgi:hypothetical protein
MAGLYLPRAVKPEIAWLKKDQKVVADWYLDPSGVFRELG